MHNLRDAGIEYGGWLPNYRAPEVFAQYRVTVHVPRRPYVEALPGIPTIRPFEALACGIPLVSSPWNDVENLFTPGEDFLVARNGQEMRKHLRALLADKQMARELAERGLRTIRARHTCAHRVDELHEHLPGGQRVNIAFFGSSLLSAYWNGAATYYRGIIRALHAQGHRITFYEPSPTTVPQHRDIEPPEWCEVVVYEGTEDAARRQVQAARGADMIVKASGVGVFDDLLEAAVLELKTPSATLSSSGMSTRP